MRSDAKAPSAGSTSGQGTSLGSFVRGAFAIRDVSGDVDGSGARSGAPVSARLLLALCLSVAAFVAFASPALAQEIHVAKNFFGGGELSVEANSGLSLNHETGVLYVGDTGNGRVAKFESSTGASLGNLATFSAPTFVAVDNSPGTGNGDVYVLETSAGEDTITKVTPAGALVTGWASGGHLGSLGTIAGIAVDDSGALWVFNTAGELRSYPPGFVTGEEASSKCTLAGGGSPTGISIDGAGRVYVTRGEEQLRALNALCEPQTNELGEAFGPAVDPADESVFFARNGRLNHAEVVAGRIETIETNIGRSVTDEGISREEGEGRANAGQLAVAPVGHELFAVVPSRGAGGEIFDFGLENVEPPTLEDPAVSEITATSAKFTAHINPHRPLGANALPYTVAYQFRCTPGCPGGSGTVPGDATNHQVEFNATGLQPGTKYKVELIAENAGGKATAPAGPPPVEFTTGAVAPSVGEVSILRVSESEAALEAQINPGGAETTYQFEYVTLAQYEASEFAEALKSAAQTLVPGGLPKQVTATIVGLTPGTRYKLRAVASNTVEADVEGAVAELKTQEPSLIATGCSNAAFRLGAGEFLPDCRGYEQATPVDKNGGSAAGLAKFIQASENGGAISYYSQAGFPGGVGAQDFATIVASRDSSSWTSHGALPPQALGERAGVLGLTSNDRYSIAQVGRGNEVALVYRDLETNEARFIVLYRPECGGNACFAYAGSSRDGTKVFFESFLPVTEAPAAPPATEPKVQNLYRWDAQTGQVVLVGQNASDEPLPEGSIAGPYEWLGQTTNGGAFANYYTGAIHAVSDDGDQAVFTEAGTGRLFVRVGLNGSSPSTIHVSKSQNPAEPEEFQAAFLEATPDGRFIFFKSFGKLTPSAGIEEHFAWNLYRYDVKTGELLDLTPESLDEEPEYGPEVQGLVGTSSDGQVAYFVALGQLAPGSAPESENLYRYDAASTPSIIFVATLESASAQAGDARVWDPHSGGALSGASSDFAKTGRVSANGEAVVFGSEKPLTGYDNQAAHCGTSSGRCIEFYRWSTATETPECLTCDATGALPLGSASLISPIFNAVNPPILGPAPTLTRNLSADGTRFFFQTPDPLSAQDTNADQGCALEGEIPTCMDVYEWEAAGSGSCHAAVVAGGCITLLSSGKSEEPSFFGDADREGDNAFIFTGSQLVPADRDHLYDVYDVSVDGGLASQWAGPPNPCVSAEACLGQGTQSGAGASPGSASFSGPPNKKQATKKQKKSCNKHAKKCKKKKSSKHKKKKQKQKSRSAAARTKSLGEEK